jgi:mannose-6-phosphate isomerase-like protein (cupin superfamily)
MNYKINIIDASHDNKYFRQELLTGPHSQVVVMSIQQGEDIGLETHKVDQILVFTQGHGQATINGHNFDINPGDLFIVPAGTEHNFTNTGTQELKLFTIYAPPQHKPGTVHKTKTEAEAEEFV